MQILRISEQLYQYCSDRNDGTISIQNPVGERAKMELQNGAWDGSQRRVSRLSGFFHTQGMKKNVVGGYYGSK